MAECPCCCNVSGTGCCANALPCDLVVNISGTASTGCDFDGNYPISYNAAWSATNLDSEWLDYAPPAGGAGAICTANTSLGQLFLDLRCTGAPSNEWILTATLWTCSGGTLTTVVASWQIGGGQGTWSTQNCSPLDLVSNATGPIAWSSATCGSTLPSVTFSVTP